MRACAQDFLFVCLDYCFFSVVYLARNMSVKSDAPIFSSLQELVLSYFRALSRNWKKIRKPENYEKRKGPMIFSTWKFRERKKKFWHTYVRTYVRGMTIKKRVPLTNPLLYIRREERKQIKNKMLAPHSNADTTRNTRKWKWGKEIKKKIPISSPQKEKKPTLHTNPRTSKDH